MSRIFTILILFVTNLIDVNGQQRHIDSFYLYGDVKITVDRPAGRVLNKKALIIFYALPNGNTTAQTMGKKIQPGDDWHYDIQHIRAQTAFIRQLDKKKNYTVIYLENDYRSWPQWKQKHPDFNIILPNLIDTLAGLMQEKRRSICLNGHSGGGSFIFGCLAGMERIPPEIKRISFLDSNYGYDSSYYPVIRQWLMEVKGTAINVFAYNDSVALFNGKPVVSPTGGTWYRSHWMLKNLQNDFQFSTTETDSLIIYKSADKRIQFFFKKNINSGIYHTQQVALNGFIHSILCGTKYDSRKYNYYSSRVYTDLIE